MTMHVYASKTHPQNSFSNAKAGKERIKEIFGVRLANYLAYRLGSEAKSSGHAEEIQRGWQEVEH